MITRTPAKPNTRAIIAGFEKMFLAELAVGGAVENVGGTIVTLVVPPYAVVLGLKILRISGMAIADG